MSAQQRTLDGDIVERSHAPRTGPAVVLWYAPKDTNFERMGEWYSRLCAEGYL